MSDWKTMADIRREYGELSLTEDMVDPCPLMQFKRWFDQISLAEITDPTAMTLSTVDEKGHPDSRIVLLKGLTDQGFIFYTNYQSSKGIQLKQNPFVSLNFYWPQMSRQVRVRGRVKRLSKEQSDVYFASRPFASQCSATISPQSQKINSRNELEQALKKLIEKSPTTPITRPKTWGGYLIKPEELEFWQGRDNRLHDRIAYYKKGGHWVYCRLAP